MGLLDRFRKPPSQHSELPWPALRERAMESLRLQTEVHNNTWQLGSASWEVDTGTGTITFTTPDVIATAPLQVVGTLAPDGTWLWGWDHPSVPPGLGQHAELVRAYGERHSVPQLVIRKNPATSDEAWEYAAVASLLAGAQGVYRGPTGGTAVFMTFGTVTLTKNPAAADPPAAVAGPLPVVSTPGMPVPQPIGPSEGLLTPQTSGELHGPEPRVHPQQVIDFVQGYFRLMQPTYHFDPDEPRDAEAISRLMAEQDTIRQRHWRRNDTFYFGGVRGNDGQYDLTKTRDWSARRIAERMWQVNWEWTAPYGIRHSGAVVMAFNDGLRMVENLFDV